LPELRTRARRVLALGAVPHPVLTGPSRSAVPAQARIRVRAWRTRPAPQIPGDPAALRPGPFAGCRFMDMSELEVYGTPAP
jgi:hypothetical protein